MTRFHATVADVERAGFSDDPLDWFVLVVDPRSEFKVCGSLLERGFVCYAPAEIRWRRTAKERHPQSFPLFPGYVFVAMGTGQSWFYLMATEGVRGVIGKPPRKVDPWRLVFLRQREDQGEFDKTRPPPSKVKPGDKVQITEEGKLHGVQAEVIETARGGQVRLMLNAAIGWDHWIADDLVEPIAA